MTQDNVAGSVGGPVDTGTLSEVSSASRAQCVKVSLVVLFHESTELLHSLLLSMAQQDYPRDLTEIVLVDDASTSDYRAALRGVGPLPRIIPVRVPDHVPCRFSTLRNRGISAASGDVIVCLDQDVIVPPGFVRAHARWYGSDRSVAVFGLRRFVDASAIDPRDRTWVRCSSLPDAPDPGGSAPKVDKRGTEVAFIDRHPAPYNCFHAAISRSSARLRWTSEGSIRPFDGSYGYEDVEFGHRLWASGVRIVHERDAEVLHLENSAVTEGFKKSSAPSNLRKLYQRVPHLREVRRRLAGAGLSPSQFELRDETA